MATEWFNLNGYNGYLRVMNKGDQVGEFMVGDDDEDVEAAVVVASDEMSVVEGSFDKLLFWFRKTVKDLEDLQADPVDLCTGCLEYTHVLNEGLCWKCRQLPGVPSGSIPPLDEGSIQ